MGISRLKWVLTQLLLVLSIVDICRLDAKLNNSEEHGPQFSIEPPNEVIFANTKGTQIKCSATGSPKPSVQWVLADGTPAFPVTGLRELDTTNGVLIIKPFSAEQYRPDIHSVTYKCSANNSAGTIVSNDVQVRGVVLQPYDVQVYDTFAIEGNTAMFKCHIPEILGAFITVSAWIKNDNLLIQTTDSDTTLEKYTITQTGDLLINEVAVLESGSQYKCKTTHKLINESVVSKNGGRLFVTAPHGNVVTKIVDLRTNVDAALGDLAIISCVAQGFPVPNIKWFRKEMGGKIVEIVGGGRFRLTKNTLGIERAQSTDEGGYICEASSAIGKDQAEIFLHVNEPLKAEIQPQIAVAKTKESVVFHCKVTGGTKVRFSWFYNGKVLQGETEPSLKIESAETTNRGMYQCMIEENKEKAQATVELRLSDIPPILLSSFNEMTLQPGGKIMLECTAIGMPVPEISWDMDGINIEGNSNVRIEKSVGANDIATSRLTIHNGRVEDGGLYTCTAVNQVGENTSSARVNVFGSVKGRKIPTKIAVSGTVVFLTCPYSGHPVSSIAWQKEGISLPASVKQKIFSNYTLVIRKTSKASDVGTYFCSLTTPEGNIVQSQVDLNVIVAPKIVPFWFQEELLREGMRARLQCVVSEGDLPLTITWMKDGLPMSQLATDSTVNVRVLDDFSSILTIGSINPRHNGNYTCVATNKATSVSHTAQLAVNVPPQIIPFAFLDDQFYKGMRAHITCAVSQGDLPISFEWSKDGHKIPSDLNVSIRKVDRHASTLSIDNVGSGHSGNYTCAATNRAMTVTHTAQLLVRGNLTNYLLLVSLPVLVAPKIVPFSFQDIHYEGSTARLVCGLLEGDLPMQFIWLKNDLPVDTSLGMPFSVHDIEGVSSILTIKNIAAEHAGNYTCLAKNRVASAKHSAVLVVNVAPKIVPFSFQGEHLFEGALARITCVVYQGDLPLTMEWLKDGGRIVAGVSGADVRQIDEYTSILTIDHVRAEHAGNYTCLAKNRAETTSHSAVLSVNVPPKIVPFTFQDDHLNEGNLARVSCVISRGDLPLNIRWEKDGKAIPANLGVVVRSFDEHSSILTIESVAEKHNGLYSCVASNAAGMSNHSTEILVKVPPTWLVKPKDVSILNGEDLTLNCQATGYPKPIISWLHTLDRMKNELAPIQGEKFNILENGSLHIQKVDPTSAGYFFCQAANGIGDGLSTMVHVKIHAPPTFKTRFNMVSTSIGKEYTMNCNAFGDTSITAQWYKEGQRLVESSSNRRFKIVTTGTPSGILSSLTLLKTSRHDQGRYECVVENRHGKNNMTFELVIQEIPDAPKEIKVSVLGSRMIELSWQKAFDGNDPITKYIIEYMNEFEDWEKSTSVETTSGGTLTGTISNLQPATNYLFRMFAENAHGRSKASPIVKGTTFEEAPSVAPAGVHVSTNNDNMLTVTWTKSPEELSRSGRVTGYYVGFKEDGKDEPYSYKTLMTLESASPEHFVHIMNLKKFTKYMIVVQACNEQGKGPTSEPIVAMTSEGVPNSVPLNVRCTTLTSQSIHMAWAPPDASGINGILRHYKIMYHAANGWYEDETHYLNATTSSATLLDLEKYTNYSLQISAVTKSGEGPYSAPIFCKTLDDVPDAPAAMKVLLTSENSVLVTWKHPLKPNGIIKSYNIYCKGAENLNDVTRNTLPSQYTQMEMPGLKKGVRYEFWVTAVNLAGEGKQSNIAAQSPNSNNIPAHVIPFDEKVTVSWKSDVTLSCQAVGNPVPQRQWYHIDELINANNRLQLTSDGSLVIRAIVEEESGDYYCIVSNSLNEDRVTYTVIVLVPPFPPTVEVIYSTSSSIEIKWRMNRSGSSHVQGYILHVRREFGDWKEITLDPDVASYRLNGLECGTNYEIVMAAFNKIGLGDKSQSMLVATNGSAPGSPPKEDLIEETSSSVSISLNAWKIHSCPILYYIVEYRAKESGDWIFAANNVKPEQRRLVIRDLTPAKWYRLRITAHSNAGSSVAEYDFATMTITGATISPNVMLRDDAGNGFSSPKVDLWVAVSAILSVLILIVVLALVCLYIKRRKSQHHDSIGKEPHYELRQDLHRNTMSRPHTEFGTMSSAGYQDDPIPYATCRLGNHNMGTLPHSGACPPVPPRHLDTFDSLDMQQRVMMTNNAFLPAVQSNPIENTFIFPETHGEMTCFPQGVGQGFRPRN